MAALFFSFFGAIAGLASWVAVRCVGVVVCVFLLFFLSPRAGQVPFMTGSTPRSTTRGHLWPSRDHRGGCLFGVGVNYLLVFCDFFCPTDPWGVRHACFGVVLVCAWCGSPSPGLWRCPWFLSWRGACPPPAPWPTVAAPPVASRSPTDLGGFPPGLVTSATPGDPP